MGCDFRTSALFLAASEPIVTPSNNATRHRPQRPRRSSPSSSTAHATRSHEQAEQPALEPAAEHPASEPLAFSEMNLEPKLLRGIEDRGFTHTTAIQTAVLPIVRTGKDLIACAETGTGKTAAFALPILERLIREEAEERAAADAVTDASVPSPAARTRVLVLTPTRELAVQVDDDVQGFAYHAGIGSMSVYGGAPMEPQSRALAAGVPIVVATPGRLLDHMRSGIPFFERLEVLVLDEADRMLDMGFWPDVARIVESLPTTRQTLLFSATFPEEIRRFAAAIMREPVFVQVGTRNAAARTITHSVANVQARDKTDWLVNFLKGEGGPVLVFVRTKRGADRLATQLAGRRVRVTALHADRTQKERMSAVEGFRAGRYQVLVATDIAARGLDIDGITHVVNYDVPHTPDAYVHRVGRTGRALASGMAVTLVAPGEERALQAIAKRVTFER
jgi:ATP-dependent RNA helicase RhlE